MYIQGMLAQVLLCMLAYSVLGSEQGKRILFEDYFFFSVGKNIFLQFAKFNALLI